MEHVNVKAFETSKNKNLENVVFSRFFGAEGGILRRLLGCTRCSAPLPPRVCSPVATKTVPRTVFPRPSNPLECQKKKDTYRVLLSFGAEGGIRTLVWFPTN